MKASFCVKCISVIHISDIFTYDVMSLVHIIEPMNESEMHLPLQKVDELEIHLPLLRFLKIYKKY